MFFVSITVLYETVIHRKNGKIVKFKVFIQVSNRFYAIFSYTAADKTVIQLKI